jgi:histidinol-phosphate/aromatic aminotransferase/cobyric acid decarboxylase-like protein
LEESVTDCVSRAAAHGGLLHDELASLGLLDDEILDVSVNVNPYGPSAGMRGAIAGAAPHRYPDPTAAPVRHAIARWIDVDPARIVVGNGAVDLLWGLARSTLGSGDAVMIVEPAFSEMRNAATRRGARIVEHRLRPETDFSLDLGALHAHAAEARPRLLYVCSPSNPVGRFTPIEGIVDLAERHPETLVVADLSFLSLSAHRSEATKARCERVVWVRSLTKDHALAGLRVGFAVAPLDLARRLEDDRPPWAVNAPAQAAAIFACTADEQRFVSETRRRLLDDCARLTAAVRSIGLRAHPSDTIFALIDLGPRIDATELRARMLRRHRILVRDATSFGLPHHVRLAARAAEDTARVVRALREEIAS